ncbi:MAG: hypothetical protein M9894_13365 [Planctomycetes bacterium]|nr:hypothetical protein [Planctomycetota bacterium]
MRRALIMAGVAALAGCAQSDAVRPISGRTAPVIDYPLEVGDRRLGAVRLWADPVREGDPGAERFIELSVRLRNDTDTPMRFDAEGAELEVRTGDAEPLLVLSGPGQVLGSAEVGPRSTGRLVLIYSLPPGVRMRQVTGFELVWSVGTEAGRLLASTTFVPGPNGDRRRYQPRRMGPALDPWSLQRGIGPVFGGFP